MWANVPAPDRFRHHSASVSANQEVIFRRSRSRRHLQKFTLWFTAAAAAIVFQSLSRSPQTFKICLRFCWFSGLTFLTFDLIVPTLLFLPGLLAWIYRDRTEADLASEGNVVTLDNRG